MAKKLPNHVPIFISRKDIGKFENYLISKGYNSIFLQIIKPRQIVGRVKPVVRKGIPSEHHVRVFTDGKITSEFELPRVDQMWAHLTTVSYSSHEKVIEFLDDANISFSVDKELRDRYNREGIDGYPKDNMEFFIWLFAGVMFWTPLGYIWRFYHTIKIKWIMKKQISEEQRIQEKQSYSGTIGN